MKTKTPIHILIRFSGSILIGGDTIEEHNKKSNEQGRFGLDRWDLQSLKKILIR